MNFKKGFVMLGLLGLLFAQGCTSSSDNKTSSQASSGSSVTSDVEAAADTATKDVEHDFSELGEETTDSIKRDGKTNEEELTNSSDLIDVEEEMAEE